MTRLTFFADIAGRLARDAVGSDRMTAAVVAILTADVDLLRTRMASLPKWRDCTRGEAESVVRLLESQAAAVSIVSMTKEPEAWERFWESAKPLQAAIVRQDNSAAGFVKPANAVLFGILSHAFPLALGHAVKTGPRTHILDDSSLEIVERTIVCDSDIQGDENITVFKSIWEKSDTRQPGARKLGFRFVTRDVIVATEQNEPLLLLADYAAGIAHSSLIPDPGRLPFPVAHEPSKVFMRRLQDSGRLVAMVKPFDLRYDEMFGEDTLAVARNHAR